MKKLPITILIVLFLSFVWFILFRVLNPKIKQTVYIPIAPKTVESTYIIPIICKDVDGVPIDCKG